MGEIHFEHPLVRIYNVEPSRLPTTRHQLSYGVEKAGCRYFAKWDADDFYAPWFLEEAMTHLLAQPGKHVKPANSWMVTGHPAHTLVSAGNVFEAAWTLDRD